jgi:hypothetical protein
MEIIELPRGREGVAATRKSLDRLSPVQPPDRRPDHDHGDRAQQEVDRVCDP